MDTDKKTSKGYIDWNLWSSYPLQWLFESRMARWEYMGKMRRVDYAMEGRPCANLYQEELTSNLKKLPQEDQQRINKAGCNLVPEGRSFVLRKAVETRANEMASGVDSYEYQFDDKYMIAAPNTADLLAAKCSQDYTLNKLGELSPTFSRDLSKYGMAAVIVKYDQEHDKNIVERINPKNCWFDTMYSSTRRERFRGYSLMISWKDLKEMIKKDGDEINLTLKAPDKRLKFNDKKIDTSLKISNHKIRTLNDLDIYVEDLNKLAASPDLQAPMDDYWEYTHDLGMCYNTNWYHTFATDPKAQTNSGYHGDDVELTVIYDLNEKIEFKIINRRYVVSANKNAFRRKIAFSIYDYATDDYKIRLDDFCLDCPLKFQFEEWENMDKFYYPTSPVMAFLDTHDELCAWRAKRDHVSKLLSILRISTNGADASSLKKTLNIMGVILDDIQGDVSTLRFEYDYTPIDSQIAYLEKTIVDGLNAYDQFDALQSMGDRASAAESGMAMGAIAQGLSTHQNAIMQLYADIARQCIANRVVYSKYSEFPVNNYGGADTITIQQMAMDAIVTPKSKLSQKIEQRTSAANALSLLGTMRDQLPDEIVSYLMQKAMMGEMPRTLASMCMKKKEPSPEEMEAAKLEAQNQANMLKQNEQAYVNNPIDYEVNNAMQNLSPDEVDSVIEGLSVDPNEGRATVEEEISDSYNGGSPYDLSGMTPEMAGYAANPNSLGEM